MSTLYARYKKYAFGGTQDDENKFGNAAVAAAGIGTGLIDAIDSPNEFGNQSSVGIMGKSALEMAGAGAAIGGPVGAAIGGGLGLVTGFIGAGKARQQEQMLRNRRIDQQRLNDTNNSAARIAGNPSLVQGYRNASMFAAGGSLPTSGMKPVNVSGTTENDTLTSYFNYIKSTQNKNTAGAEMALKHIQDVRGPQTATNMQFLGKQLGTSNIQDIARRSTNETDPQMKLLYNTLRENPGIIDRFQYASEMKQPDLAKHATGGTLQAPLTKAYMAGGYAKPLSSGTTEIEGNTHDEGGVKIPQIGAEVEEGETTSGNFVFSKELGFASMHKPIAKAMGIIEKKPQTAERINAMKLLKGQENKLALTQEYYKKANGIQ